LGKPAIPFDDRRPSGHVRQQERDRVKQTLMSDAEGHEWSSKAAMSVSNGMLNISLAGSLFIGILSAV
jgi:hypothetical protein